MTAVTLILNERAGDEFFFCSPKINHIKTFNAKQILHDRNNFILENDEVLDKTDYYRHNHLSNQLPGHVRR